MDIEIAVKITGVTPLILNAFHEEAQIAATAGVRNGTAGAHRAAPREDAAKRLYRSEANPEVLVLPQPNMLRCLIDAGTFIKMGKSKVSTLRSSLVPAGIVLEGIEIPILHDGWEVDTRPVVIPATGGRIQRHRPRFDSWSMEFSLSVDTTVFAAPTVRDLVDIAGSRVGLGDFRPARRGPFGRFKVVSWSERALAEAV